MVPVFGAHRAGGLRTGGAGDCRQRGGQKEFSSSDQHLNTPCPLAGLSDHSATVRPSGASPSARDDVAKSEVDFLTNFSTKVRRPMTSPRKTIIETTVVFRSAL